VNGVSLNAKFVAVPTLEFNFTGVQNQSPLTSLKRQDANVVLTSGLSYGPGLTASNIGNVGNEFNVAGFSGGATQQSALDANDYLTFSVQPITGMAMFPDSVSFSLWRESNSSATYYDLFSSVGGFGSGQQLAGTHVITTGAANQLVLTGSFASPQPTTDPVEFRLYGWGASSAADNTHLTAASMRARFTSVVGVPVDPTGAISVQGDFFHIAGGSIAIDLAGRSAGNDYDQINVQGKVTLEGDLNVALADAGGSPFSPVFGDAFTILTATQGISGQFANMILPQLPWDVDWQVAYSANAVTLNVITTGDFNKDGIVNTADFVIWRMNAGNQAEYDVWRSNFGRIIATGATLNASSVPEPSCSALIVAGSILCFALWANRKRRVEIAGVEFGTRLATSDFRLF
jgi:hypothetical protein